MNKYLLRCLLVPLFTAICVVYDTTAMAQNKEEFDNLVFIVPKELSISRSTNSLRLTDSTAGAGEDFSITINKSTFSLKKIERSFPLFWKESLVMDGFDGPVEVPQFVKSKNNAGWDCFRGGKTVSYNAQSTPQYYHLTVVKYLGLLFALLQGPVMKNCSHEKYHC